LAGEGATGKAQEMVKDKEIKALEQDRPAVYVLAGANGTGQTTFAFEFLLDFVKCREFLNADLMAPNEVRLSRTKNDRRAVEEWSAHGCLM
jgi:hypothetical protein